MMARRQMRQPAARGGLFSDKPVRVLMVGEGLSCELPRKHRYGAQLRVFRPASGS
jgi:hypothetical protein